MTALPYMRVIKCVVAMLISCVCAHLLRSSNAHDLSCASSQSSLAADHLRAITQHSDTHEWVGISVPIDDRLIVLPGTTGDTFVGLA